MNEQGLREAKRAQRKELRALELKFYEVQEAWLFKGEKKDWDVMWVYVQRAVESAMKKRLTGIKRNDVDELILDATCTIMQRFRKPKGYHIDHLLTVAYWAVIGVLYDEKLQRQDEEVSYEAWMSSQLAMEGAGVAPDEWD